MVAVPSVEGVRGRLDRVRTVLAGRGAEVAVFHDGETVRYLTGIAEQRWDGALVLTTEESVLVRFTKESPSGVDRQIVVEPFPRDLPMPLPEALRAIVASVLAASGGAERVGVEKATLPGWLAAALEETGLGARSVDVASEVRLLRRSKDPDELAVVEWNARLAEAAYGQAREAIRRGTTELAVYTAMVDAVQEIVGGPVRVIGDFAAGPGGGSRGGPPTDYVLADGDTYVIDFQIGVGGYWVDLTRTFPVGTPPPEFAAALALAEEALAAAEELLVPGTPTAEVDRAVRSVLARRPDLGGDSFFHLTGHGSGVVSHEPPWIGARTEDVLVEGDVIAIEPGLYADMLAGGVRLEDNYVVECRGARRISAFSRQPGGRG